MNRRRSFAALGALCAVAVLATACSSSKKSSDPGPTASAAVAAPANLKSSGKITFCSGFTNPPRVYQKDGKDTGMEHDLAVKLAETMGLQPTFVQIASTGLIPGLLAKRCDMLVDEFVDNPARRNLVNWLPSSYALTQIVVPKGNPKNINSFADMPGHKVAVPDGSLAQRMVTAYNKALSSEGKPQIKMITLADTQAMFTQVGAGVLDAAIATDSSAAYYTKLAGGTIAYAGEPCTSATSSDDRVGFLIRKEDTALFDAMKQAMDVVRKSGDYDKILTDYGMDSISLGKFGDKKIAHCLPDGITVPQK